VVDFMAGEYISMTNLLLYLLLGAIAGILSGLIGIGGGVLIAPVLVFGFGMSQHMAQGTTLALLVPPVGLLAAWTYYQQGDVDVKVAVWIAVGYLFGGLLGAKFAVNLSNLFLEKVFGGAILVIALKMIFSCP
jgi:uncharacterized protein